MLTEMRWLGWSNGRAKGVGRYEVNDCKPTCVAGTTRSYPARVLLSRPADQAGARVLSRATMTFVKAGPAGRHRLSVAIQRYVAPASTPAPSATAAPTASASPSSTPTATPSAAPTPTASATATPTPTATTASAVAIAPPTVTIDSQAKLTAGLRVTVLATSKAKGGNAGITSVTGYRSNDESADLTARGAWLGAETGNGDVWNVIIPCGVNFAPSYRIVVTAADGQTSTVRHDVTGNC